MEEEVFPASFAQQRLWFVDQFEPERAAYNIAQAFRLGGPLDAAALEKSLNEIVRRHEILRTTFRKLDGEPAQIVHAPAPRPLERIDLSGIAAGAREREAARRLEAEAHRPFDLAAGPLFRAALFRLDEAENILLVVMHHIVSDGWSMNVFYRELAELYDAFSRDKIPDLPELPIQYADFAVWQRDYLAGGIIDAELDYWKKQLASMPLEAAFPNSAAPGAGRRAERQMFTLSKSLSGALKALGRDGDATLFMTLLAGFYVWLRRHTGREDLVVATPVAGRNRAEIEGLIGFFVNTLLLRADVSGQITFRELLARVRMMSLEALTHQNVPFEKVVAALPRKHAHQDSLAQAAFAFQPTPAALVLRELTAARVEISPGGAKHALTLFMWNGAEAIEGGLEYDTGVFDSRAVAGMIEDFQNVLAAIVAGPERRLAELAPVIATGAGPERAGALDLYERANLTQNQLLVWLGQKLQPGVPLYNVAVTFEIAGEIDPFHFRRALQTLVDASDALRTVIEEIDGAPRQKILDRVRCEVEWLDLSAAADPWAALDDWAKTRSRRPFDLGACLFDTALVKLAADRFVWYWNQHHIVTDGEAIALIYRHLSELYGRSLAGGLESSAALPRFRDYVEHERAQRGARRYAEAEAYWTKKLAEKITPLDFYGGAPAKRSAAVERLSLELGAERTRRLKALAGREELSGTTEHAAVFTIFAAALLAYLYRLHGAPLLSIGVPLRNRTRLYRETIGLFMEVFPLRVALEADDNFLSIVRKVRAALSELRAFRTFTLANPPGDRLYDVLLNYHTAKFPRFNGMAMRQQWIHTGHENDALALQVRDFEDSGSLMLDFDFHRDVFDDEQRGRAAAHFLNVLEIFLADPARPLRAVDLLTADERRRVLAEFNRSAWEPRAAGVLSRRFEAAVEKNPGAAALTVEGETLTYGELNARANRLARRLRALGAGANVVVGLCAEPSAGLLVGMLGILKAGAAYLPLDPEYPIERLSFMLGDAGARIVVTERRWIESVPALAELARGRTAVYMDSDADAIAAERAENFDAATTPRDLAYVMYTSGSTGAPKGVMIEHGAICNRIEWGVAFYGLGPGDRMLQKSTFAFDASVWEIFEPLLAGAAIVMAAAAERRNLAALAALMARREVTVAEFAPSALAALLEEGGIAGCRSLKRVFSGGEALTAELEKLFLARLPAELYNSYGPTEASVDVAHWKCGAGGAHPSVPIGRPVAGMKIYILDARLDPVPIGAAGELVIGGAGLARGYINRPELTAEKFVPDPFAAAPGARLYRTGDLARHLPDGDIEFIGRVDNQIKIRGFRVEPGEIEAALARHPGVREAAVIAREDAPGHKRLAAYIVPARGAAPGAHELREFLKERLPDYMVPAIFVPLDAMPLTPSNKIDRRALPAPDKIALEPGAGFVAPEGPVETALARIWSEVLKLERVGARDNFFELGGDSILSIQIVAKANQAGLRLTPKDVFQFQTIAELATAHGATPAVRAEQGAVTGAAPLTPIQRMFFEHDPVEPHHWNMAMLLDAREPLNFTRVERAVAVLLVHHDALRLRFAREDAGWRQWIAAPDGAPAPVGRVDLSALPEDEQSRAIDERAAEIQASLSLADGPLLRVCVFDLGASRPSRLLFAVHHLAIDAVSWRILLEDFEVAYRRAGDGAPPRLPAKTTSFKHWAERLAEHARSDKFKQEAEYWVNALRQAAAPLPRDHAAGADSIASARSVSVALESEETRALLQRAPEVYRVRVDDLLLTALAQAFARWTQSGALLVDVEGHGREEIVDGVDLTRTVGWFTSLYPVRLELPAGGGAASALKAIKEQLRAIPHRGIGYGLLRYLCDDPALAEKFRALPRAEVSFNYLGRFDEILSDSALLARSASSAGPVRSPAGHRSHLLEINGSVGRGRLGLTWTYSENIHRRATIEKLAAHFIEALRALIDHCRSPEAGGYTPSDFPDAELTQTELDEILARLDPSMK